LLVSTTLQVIPDNKGKRNNSVSTLVQFVHAKTECMCPAALWMECVLHPRSPRLSRSQLLESGQCGLEWD
jgi:hypothetical protein